MMTFKLLSNIYKSILITLLLVATCQVNTLAQQNYTLYNMNSISQSIYCNPSTFPINNINVGIPALSSNYFGVTNTAFRYRDLIYKRPDDSLTFDMNKAISKMADNNYLLTHAQIDLLSFGFKIKRNYFNFTATEKFTGIINYSKGLIDFLWNGNGPQIGKTINIGLGLQYSHYREYGLNYVVKINQKLNVGIKFKYLYGMENIQTERAGLTLYTEPSDYALRAQSDVLINKSGAITDLVDSNIKFGEYAFGLKNSGKAIDLGGQYKITDKISVNASLIDFGGIKWRSNVQNFKSANPEASYTYRGLYIGDIINDTTTINQAFNTVLDSAYATFRIDTTFNTYRTKLNKQVYLGGTYHLTERFQTNLVLHGLFIDGKMRSGISASIGGKLGELVHMNLCYSIFNKSYNNLGWGVSINTWGGSQFYVVSDNILGAIFPQNAKSFNLRIGMNLRFGTDPYSDDTDGDGVPDSEDKCPKAKGPLEMKGCPDSDNDRVADFEDQCPDDYGLPRFKGCPDKDGDNIIDKFDKCPDVPGAQRFQGCPDRDDDGVRDDEDLCPDVKGLIEMKGCPDADGDGIKDAEDKCPNDFGTIENNGCPVDKDNDGVPDIDDLCPTEPGSKENKGCPSKDTDQDGLLDKDDDCPQTKGTIANKGCPELTPEENVIAKTATESIKFETGKEEFLSLAYEHLDKLSQTLKANPSIILKMEVHTDNTTSDSFAMTLTKDRAAALQEYFIKKGIDSSRLKIVPFGDTKSIADNNTNEGKEKNNRVEVSFGFN
jgi:outer membrane protein OmpA-like peptidoglycan-associated protein